MRFVEGCLACRTNKGIVKPPGGPILEGKYWRLEHTLLPTVPGWLILKSRSHVISLAQMPRNAMVELADMLYLAEAAIVEVVRPERVYVVRFGDVVEHFHFHLLPRRADMAMPGANGAEIFSAVARTPAWHGTADEVDRACSAIRAVIAERAE